jgi:hypothetical protein
MAGAVSKRPAVSATETSASYQHRHEHANEGSELRDLRRGMADARAWLNLMSTSLVVAEHPTLLDAPLRPLTKIRNLPLIAVWSALAWRIVHRPLGIVAVGSACCAVLAASTASAEPLASAEPAAEQHTAASVAGDRRPGDESGRTDPPDPGDSAWREVARGALFVPKLALELVLSPVRGLVWADDRYDLTEVYYRTFFNADRTIGVFPTATYDSGFGVSAGARLEDRNLFGAHESLALQATTGALSGETYRAGLLASLHTGDRLSRWLHLGLDANLDRRPSDPFYGIGNGDVAMRPASPIDPRVEAAAVETEHRYQEERIALSADVHPAGHLQALARSELTQLRFAPSTEGPPIDEVYDPAGLVGFQTGVRHLDSELEVRWDSRRSVSLWEPHDVRTAGSLAAAFVGRVDGLDGAASFWRYGVELQHDWEIAKGPRVLAVRFHGEGVTGSLDQVPFTELPALGGGAFLRGYAFERFRDRVAAFGSLQYAWGISHLVDAYLFSDAGRVFSSLDDLTAHDMRLGYGVGLELHDDQGAFRAEASLASSIDGGVFLTLSFNPAFDARPRWR